MRNGVYLTQSCKRSGSMAESSNPFEAPCTKTLIEESAEREEDVKVNAMRFRRAAWLFVYLYPAWLVLSFYAVWLLAWHELGHRPRPMLDDPKSVGGVLTAFGNLPGIFLMAGPVFAPLGLASCFLLPGRMTLDSRLFFGFALVVLYVALVAATLNFLWWDPHQVVEWWFD